MIIYSDYFFRNSVPIEIGTSECLHTIPMLLLFFLFLFLQNAKQMNAISLNRMIKTLLIANLRFNECIEILILRMLRSFPPMIGCLFHFFPRSLCVLKHMLE